jgi:hypothetical protein
MVLVISERCSCGSKVSVHDLPLADAKKLVREWRRSHECSSADTAEYAGSTASLTTERDTVGFQRNNYIQYFEEE